MALMRHSGVQWVRVNFDWSQTEPTQGQFNWAEADNIVAAAAKNHLSLLPVVEFTPQWASTHPSAAWTEYAPRAGTFAPFMTALIPRYGPHGTFWSTHGPKRPVRAWQIWNEPEGTNYDWRSVPFWTTYTAFLKEAYRAAHRADHGATVVTGALVALSCVPECLPWNEAKLFYRAGFKRYFDVLAVNDFTLTHTVQGTVDYNMVIVQRVRNVMRQYHDLRKPIWITELTWTAALGRIPKRDYLGFETTPKGQAARLTAFYTRLAAQHPNNIQRAFWFDWTSTYSPTPEFTGSDISFQYAGLLKWAPGDPVFQRLPLLKAYAKVAHRYANR
jgi:hypothetical protein